MFVFTSRLILHWKAALELKYPAVLGITGMHDILLSKKSGKVVISYRDTCFNGEYTTGRIQGGALGAQAPPLSKDNIQASIDIGLK